MNCNETSEVLELLLLAALEPAEAREAAEHLSRCPACRAERDRLHLLLCEVQVTAEPPGVRAGLADASSAAARADLAAKPVRRLWPRVVTWAAAAAAAVLVVLALPHQHPAPPTEAPRAAAAPVERWRHPAPPLPADAGPEGVVVQGQSVYLLEGAAGQARIVAVDAGTGRTRWTSKTPSGGYIEATGERVFCLSAAGDRAGDLICLSADDGRPLWRFPAGGGEPSGPPCRPLALRDRWVCWSSGADLVLLDAASGQLMWRRTFDGNALPSRPVAVGENVCLATRWGLWSVEVAGGAARSLGRFERRLPGEGHPLLAMAGARAYLAGASPAGAGQLYCLDVPTGQRLWHREIPQTRSISAAGAGVYLRAQRVTALDGYTGRTLWTRAAEGTGPVSVQRGMVCFVDSGGGGRLVGLDPAGGRCLWQVAGVRSFHGLSPDCAVAYVQGADGGLRAVAVIPGGTGIPATPWPGVGPGAGTGGF